MSKSIYDLKLHEGMLVGENDEYHALRVPGGWIYTVMPNFVETQIIAFVPYDREFKEVDSLNLKST